MPNTNVAAILACYNRKEKTVQAITSIAQSNPNIHFTFFVVDDHSTDGTKNALLDLKGQYDIQILSGKEILFYSKSMHLAMKYIKKYNKGSFQYTLLLNDDVFFYPQTIERMLQQSQKNGHAVIIGATVNHKGIQSYGAIKYFPRSIRYRMLSPTEHTIKADTFNGNCVLIPWETFVNNESMDSYYIHGMGDFDYGMMLRSNQVTMYSSKEYVGSCENNPPEGTWLDPSLPVFARLKRKEEHKGLPMGDWFHYLRKHFGLRTALIRSITPYIKILMHK